MNDFLYTKKSKNQSLAVKTLQHNQQFFVPIQNSSRIENFNQNINMRTATLAILIYLSIHCVYAWDTDELEIFDLVEEINQNFYNVLGVQQVRLKEFFFSLNNFKCLATN